MLVSKCTVHGINTDICTRKANTYLPGSGSEISAESTIHSVKWHAMCKIVSYVAMDIREKYLGEVTCIASACWLWSKLELFFPDWRHFFKNFRKLWTIFWFVIPATLHDLVDLIRALLWTQHSVTCIQGNKSDQKYANCRTFSLIFNLLLK